MPGRLCGCHVSEAHSEGICFSTSGRIALQHTPPCTNLAPSPEVAQTKFLEEQRTGKLPGSWLLYWLVWLPAPLSPFCLQVKPWAHPTWTRSLGF